MTYDSLTNRQDFFSAHYLAELLPAQLRKGAWKDWTEAARDGAATPRTRLRAGRQPYQTARHDVRDADETLARKLTAEWHRRLLTHLGVAEPQPQTVTVLRGDVEYTVDVAHAEGDLVAIDGGFATDVDEAFDDAGAGRLLNPVTMDGVVTGADLAGWMLTAEDPPRYILLLHGGVVVLADRYQWGDGKYLAVSLDTVYDRNDTTSGGELDLIAALFSVDMLRPPADGGEDGLSQLVTAGRRHAEGVSTELRHGLKTSVELIANEVLARLRAAGVAVSDIDADCVVASRLTRESLRYLYRILFLLYAEARPDLGILPVDNPEYAAGYSMNRLGELVVGDLDGNAEDGFHLYESIDRLSRLVNDGHRYREAPGDSEGAGIRFEALRSVMFEPTAITLIGERTTLPDSDVVDTRLRNKTLHAVLRRLMLTSGSGKKQGGFISYAQLGINQLGAVYEGLMSYTGRIATETLNEVAKKGDSKDGSWLVPAARAADYDNESFVEEVDPFTGVNHRRRYEAGSFVYRLAGRDRQISASYYTPKSLTEVTVQLAVKYRIEEADDDVTANDLLRWRICEPALGSGAFLNEAIDQVAQEYLARRTRELGTDLPPEQYATELAKVKAYIALHNAYGVDLNDTAVELAEVSLWLNVMHPGLRAPWFGLHLRRGNSLIGARRAYYPSTAVRAKDWLKTAPVEHPFRDGDLPEKTIHHFLLPADGWGAVAGEKEAKALAPEQTKRLADWRRGIKAKPKEGQIKRLERLSERAEYLWRLVIERLWISEREISRRIDVWGAEGLPEEATAYTKEHVKEQLERVGAPFWRLKTLMDTWSALWFWRVQDVDVLVGESDNYPEEQPFRTTGAIRQQQRITPLASLDDWIDFAEALLGTQGLDENSLAPKFTGLAELKEHEEQLQNWTGMVPWRKVLERFPWLGRAIDLAEEHGFFHWELHYAHVFADGGFDLQVGNPPWVRPRWDEKLVLAEREPWFALADKPSTGTWRAKKDEVLAVNTHRDFYLDELAANTGIADFTSDIATYPLLAGTQPDLYRCFMIRSWANLGKTGTAGLIHPGTHFSGKREGTLRAAAYRHLRLHAGFVNVGNWAFASPISRTLAFALHVYGTPQTINFRHLSELYDASIVRDSLSHSGEGSLPGVKFGGFWDRRSHKARVIQVDDSQLSQWNRLIGGTQEGDRTTQLLGPITTAEQGAIEALANVRTRLGDLQPRISGGYHEKGAKDNGYIEWNTTDTDDWSDVILQGPHFGIATPLAKQPRIPCTNNSHYDPWDHADLADATVPRTNYVRASSCSPERFIAAQDRWVDHDRLALFLADPARVTQARAVIADRDEIAGSQVTDAAVTEYLAEQAKRPYTEFYRVAWREMVPQNTERSLFPALIPPGPSHIHAVRTAALPSNRKSAVVAGVMSSLPMDYLLRISGRGHLDVDGAKAIVVPNMDHSLTDLLILRTLRLNCLTNAYAPLWAELYDAAWRSETWARPWEYAQPLGDIGPDWERATPLRT
ncbi:MAG TPA: hypothetical protein H9881_08680, partial [Candidatus Stackebrandtia excrementipullorum]|nr:hypothetical protein [Candidatus Stackebrandtia excrementipullorum]